MQQETQPQAPTAYRPVIIMLSKTLELTITTAGIQFRDQSDDDDEGFELSLLEAEALKRELEAYL